MLLLLVIQFSINNCSAMNKYQNNISNINSAIKELCNHTADFFYDINLVKCSQLIIDNVINKHIKLILYLNYVNDSLIPHNFYENISDENEKCHVIELLSDIRNNVKSVIEDCLNNKQNTI